MFLLITSLLFSFATWSQSCNGLKNGEEIRLDSPGNSLANFKAQDQDGMGTCYANSGSVLLQSALKDHPSISYIHLASLYNKENFDTKRLLKDKSSYGGTYAQGDDLAISGGQICDPIKKVQELQKKSGKAVLCDRKNVNIEKMLATGDLSEQQNRSLIEPAKYMDLFQKNFSGIYKEPTFWSGRKERAEADSHYYAYARGLGDLLEGKKKKITEECKTRNPSGLTDLFRPLLSYYLKFDYCLEFSVGDSDCWALNALAKDVKKVGDKLTYGHINPRLSEKLSKQIFKANKYLTQEDVKAMVADALGSEAARGILYPINRSRLKNKILKQLDDIPTKIFYLLAKENNQYMAKGYSDECVERNLFLYLASPEFKSDWKADKKLCQYEDLLEQAPAVALSFKDTGLNDINNVTSFLTYGARLTYDDVFLRHFAFNCNDSNKIKIPENLTCSDTPFNRSKKPIVEETILKNLKRNQAVGLYLCGIAYRYDTDEPNLTKFSDCGRHGVAITGMKCEKGQIHYLVQNSWGKEHNPANPHIKKDHKNNGASWFDDKVFYQAGYQLSTLEIK